MRLSCDDGCASDMRVADLAMKYEIETVFYLPVEWRSLAYDNGYEPLTFEDAARLARDFEIGSHTITHRHLTSIQPIEAMREIVESKVMLEHLFHKPVTKFCPPRGYTNDDLSRATLKIYNSQRLTRGKGLLHVHPKSGANQNLPWREYAKTIEVEEIWMHSWELDKYNLWDELESYLAQ